MDYQWWWHGMGFMWVFPLLFMVVMAIVFCGGMWRMGRGHGSRGHANTPREILDRRLAAGEITEDQYEQIKRVLAR